MEDNRILIRKNKINFQINNNINLLNLLRKKNK